MVWVSGKVSSERILVLLCCQEPRARKVLEALIDYTLSNKKALAQDRYPLPLVIENGLCSARSANFSATCHYSKLTSSSPPLTFTHYQRNKDSDLSLA